MEILASGQLLVIIGCGAQTQKEDNTISIGKKEALQLKKFQINGYKVPNSKSHQFIIVQKMSKSDHGKIKRTKRIPMSKAMLASCINFL